MTATDIRAKLGVASRQSRFADHHDDFPTPPWATRAFFKYVAPELVGKQLTFLDPACGRGHMIRVLREYGFRALAFDNYRYDRSHRMGDYLDEQQQYPRYDVMMTNPPYRYADEFVQRALREASVGVAMLVRTMWLEGQRRQLELFGPHPPLRVVVFSRRMQSTYGKVIQHGQAMMSHSWFWWNKQAPRFRPILSWLPPTAQQELERDSDYNA
jgi:hypothetical protein